MATITLTAFGGGFDTDDFFSGRSSGVDEKTATSYKFLSVIGYYVQFTGTGFTYTGLDPTGGVYDEIRVYSDNTYTTVVDTFTSITDIDLQNFYLNFRTTALGGDDDITGSTSNDIITGYGGADNMDGRDGNDTYVFSTGDVVAGEIISDGGNAADTDTIEIRHIGGNNINFTVANVSGIEALTFDGAGTVTFNQNQLPTDLAITGAIDAGVSQTVVIMMTTTSFDASGWTFSGWEEAYDSLTIFDNFSGDDTIIGSSHVDVIASFGGADALDGRDGSDRYGINGGVLAAGFTITDTGTGVGNIDVIQLTSDTDFTQAGAISGIEQLNLINDLTATIKAAQLPSNLDVFASAGFQQRIAVVAASNFSAAAWTFTNWDSGHSLSITGTAGNDTIVGSSQVDLIAGGAGGDSLDGGEGGDQYAFAGGDVGAGEAIHDTGASGVDTLLIDASVDFSGASAITGIELLKFSSVGHATFKATHLAANTALEAVGPSGHTLTVNEATAFTAAGWTFTNWGPTSTIVINGGAAADVLTGSTQIDLINGGVGADTIEGGLGDDFLDGGGDVDVASYASSSVGVTVSLALNVQQNTIGAGLDTLTGFEGLTGSATGADKLTGDVAANVLSGLGGNDTLIGGAGGDRQLGGAGNDTFEIKGSEGLGDVFRGGDGTDKIKVTGTGMVTLASFTAKISSVEQWIGNGKGLAGTAAGNAINLGALTKVTGLAFVDGKGGSDLIVGSKFADTLRGGDGNDALLGGIGTDVLVGGAGRDYLTGGAQADRFDFDAVAHIGTWSTRDVIKDFSTFGGDIIDLGTLDANSKMAKNDTFSFIKTAAFGHKAGELRYVKQDATGSANDKTIVEGDINGDGKADFQIELTGLKSLSAGDFAL